MGTALKGEEFCFCLIFYGLKLLKTLPCEYIKRRINFCLAGTFKTKTSSQRTECTSSFWDIVSMNTNTCGKILPNTGVFDHDA